MSTQIQVVLPLKVNNSERGSDFDRIRSGLVPSLRRFCNPKFITKLTVVVPEGDIDAASTLISSFDCPAEVISENSLVPSLSTDLPRRGWYLQQFIKIAYSRMCETPFYLTLDADIFLLNPLGPEIFRDGRAPANYEPVTAHAGWWVRSAMVTDARIDAVQHDEHRAFGVTPAFLSSEIMRGLIERLDQIAKREGCSDWVNYLCRWTSDNDDTWTEYSLYWTHLINVCDATTIYYERPVYRFSHYPHLILNPVRQEDAGAELFGVLQSSHVTVADFAATVQALLPSVDTAAAL